MARSAFGDHIDNLISNSFVLSLDAERQEELKVIGKSWDFYYGHQEQYIRQYRGENDDDFNDKDKPTFNYTKAIVNEYVNGVFAKPVIIQFEKDENQKIWESIVHPLTFFNIVPFFMKCQRIAEVSNTCLVMIRYNKKTRQTYFEDIRGEFVYFLPKEENPKEIGTLIISYNFDTGDPDPQKRIMKRVEIWDDEKWEVWIHSPFLGEEKLLNSGPNPYKLIPAAKLCPEEDDNTNYGITNIPDVVRVNEIYNNLWTILMRICVYQSFSVLVVKSDQDLNLTLAPTRFLNMEGVEEGDAQYVTPQPKINEVEKVLMDLKMELQDVAHVPSEVMASSKGLTPESGYALRIKRIPIEQEWERRRMSYGPSVKDLCKKTVIVDNVNKGKSGDVSDMTVDVAFHNTTAPLAPQEQILTDEQQMRYNLITPVDLMLRERPELERDEAKEMIEKNKKEMEEMGFTQFGGDNETEFEKLKVRMGRKAAGIKEAATPPEKSTVGAGE
jgi:hypothetical protein